MIEDLITETRKLIEQTLASSVAPAMLCSFGKESMLLLALAREQRPDILVVYFPVYDHPTKHNFAHRIIEDWGLRMWRWVPSARDIIGKDDHVEIVEGYRVTGDAYVTLPIEAEPDYVPDADCHCAVERLNSYLGDTTYVVDTLLIGHRGDDVDPTHGAVPVADYLFQREGLTVAYPLRDWTEADIWAASDLLGIPQNEARYSRGEMSANADYFMLCTNCLKPNLPGDTVACPKGGEVLNLGKYLDLDARREAWRQRFVNIARP